MKESDLVKFVEWIDGELETLDEGRGDISPEAFIWYNCLKQTSLVAVKNYSDSSKGAVVSHFDEWYLLYKMDKPSEDQVARRRELERYAASIINANQESMRCAMLWETQGSMADLEKEVKEKISYKNNRGKQVIKPECFLSWEVAAYVILHSWNKQMGRGLLVKGESDLAILGIITKLIELEEGNKFEESAYLKLSYQGLARSLWMYLIARKEKNYSMLFRETHRDIFELAMSIGKEKHGLLPDDSLDCESDEWGDPYRNPHRMVEAYEAIRDYITPLTREESMNWARGKGFDLGELNSRHYNLF